MLVRSTPLWAGTLTLVSLGLDLPAVAADFTVTTQGQFDAAVAAATQPGAADTINVDTPLTSAGTMLSLPGGADSVTINFNGVSGGPATANPAFDVGFGTTGQLNMGGGTTLNFNTDNGVARLRVGYFDGVNAGNGTVNMTGGTIAGTHLSPSQYFVIDVGRGSTGSVGAFNQSGGLVDLAGGAFQVGVAGATGTYTLSNDAVATMGAATVYLGDGVGGSGTLYIHDDAQYVLSDPGGHGQVYVGNDSGSGLIVQDGAGSQVVLNAQNGVFLGVSAPGGSGVGGTGEYRISAGQLVLGGLSSGTAGITLGADDQGTGIFTQTGGTVTLNTGQIRFGPGTGKYDLNGGTLQVGVANPFAAATANYEFNLGGGTIQALTGFSTGLAFSLTGGTSTIDTNGFNAAFSGVLDGVGTLSKAGTGALTLSGNNTYSGGTVLNGGTVVVGSATAFGTGDVTFAGSTTLQFAGNYTLANGTTIDAGVLATMNTNGNTDTLSGVIDGAGALQKTGAGTLIFTAATTYTGGTQIAAGTLQLGTGGSLAATGALQIDSLGTFDLNNQDQTVASLSGDGTILVGTGDFTAGGNNANTAFSGTVTMTNQGYQSPYGTFAKVGAGTLTIDNATFELGETYIRGGKMAQTSGDTSITYLAVGDGTGTVGGLDVSGGTITFGTGLQVGAWGGQGTVNQTGGTVQVVPECGNPANCAAMHIGNQGGTGTYNISGGELDLSGRLNSIGRSTGTNPGSTGTLNISGTGVVDVAPIGGDPSRLIVGLGNSNAAQAQSQGTINQTGGTLRIHNGATLNIGGQNTSSGIYNLYGGTLEVGGAGLVAGYLNANPNYEFNLGGGTVKVIEAALTTGVDATLSSVSTIDTNGFGATWSGVLSGDGALVKAGDGALIFNAANTYTGGTEIAAGTLRLGTGGSLAATGALQIDDLGTFDLNGQTQTVGEFAGEGDVLLGLGTLTAGGALNTEFSGSFSGGGTFEKKGSGTLYLTGDSSSFTGDTLVNGGKLVVNGSLASEVTVESGTLGGSGTIGGLIVSGDGTMAPGNSIGTINVVGNVIFQNQSIYEVEVNGAGQTDLIEATGTATMNGGTVQVLAQAGAYSPLQTYTILTSVGARQGEFDDVMSNLAFLTPTLDYDDHNVFLTLTGNGTAFVDVARTRNERATAQALSQFPQDNPLYENIIGQSAAGAQQALDALSGEMHASVSGILADQSRFVRNNILDRLVQAFYAAGGTQDVPVAALGTGGGTVVAAVNTGFDGRMGLGTGEGGDGRLPTHGHELQFWTQGYGSWGNFEGDGNAASAQRNIGGFVSGVDAAVGDGWRGGLATGYAQSNVSVGARASSADVDSYLLAAYAGGGAGPFALRSGAAWNWHSIDATRNVIFPGFNELEKGSYDGDTGQLFAEAAYPILLGPSAALEPFANVAWVHVSTDAFTESGPVAGLVVAANDNDIGYSTIGARAAVTLPVAGMLVTPRGSLAWQYAFGDTVPGLALAFATTNLGFGVAGVPLAQNSALIEAGADVLLWPDAKLGLSYVGQFADRLQDNGLQGRLDVRF